MKRQQPLRHLAIIPDGNRRWAKKHGINAEPLIYEQGSQKTSEILEAAFSQGVEYVTFWASSYANLASRPKLLVHAIDAIYARKFEELATYPMVFKEKVNIQIIGEWRQLLKPSTIQAGQKAIDATAHHHDKFLTILVGYDGQRERGQAVQGLLRKGAQPVPTDVLEAEQLLRQHAWTGNLPDVDLLIRTGAWQDPHNSASFLSFLSGESQFAFPHVLWPDFSADMLTTLCDDFSKRERRYGR